MNAEFRQIGRFRSGRGAAFSRARAFAFARTAIHDDYPESHTSPAGCSPLARPERNHLLPPDRLRFPQQGVAITKHSMQRTIRGAFLPLVALEETNNA